MTSNKETQKAITFVWSQLDKKIKTVSDGVRIITNSSERAETAGGHVTYTFATLPTGNNSGGDEVWCSNCRKVGEGAGVGTGCMAYWNPATSTWKRHRDDTDMTA